MDKLEMVYEGKAKKVFRTDDPNSFIVEYKDSATAFNGIKKGEIQDKGIVNNRVSNHLFKLLEKTGIETHYVEEISDRETIVKKVDIVPIEVIVRNIAAGSLTKKLGIPEGQKLATTVLEFCYKNDDLGDPLINTYHIAAMELATEDEVEAMTQMAFAVNTFLTEYLKDLNVELIDFKLEFGRYEGRIILADEISPDTCRFWDSVSKEKLDKDRFRQDLDDVNKGYREILKRLLGE